MNPLITSPVQQLPLLPKSDPPPLPKSEPPPMMFKTSEKQFYDKQTPNNFQELNINKAILDNIKVIDNWKYEQEILMRVYSSFFLFFLLHNIF